MDKCFYEFIVSAFDPDTAEAKRYHGITRAEGYSDAADAIAQYYGEELEWMQIYEKTDNSVYVFEDVDDVICGPGLFKEVTCQEK